MKGNIPCALLTFLFFTFLNIEAQNLAPEIEWQRSLGGSAWEIGNSIRQTTDGGFITVGFSSSSDGDVAVNYGFKDFWVAKLSNTGILEWEKSLGSNLGEIAQSVEQTNDGGYIIAGYFENAGGTISTLYGGEDIWVVKINNVGTIEWEKVLGGSGNDAAFSVKQTLDSGYVIAGYSSSTDFDVTGNHGDKDYWIVKLDNLGVIEWERSLGGSNIDEARSIIQLPSGEYIVIGHTESFNGDVTGYNGGKDYWVVKLNNLGNIIWQKTLGGSNADYGKSIIQTIGGGFIVTGTSTSFNGDVLSGNGTRQYWLVKLDNLGNITWENIIEGTPYDGEVPIQQTTDQGYIIASVTNVNTVNSQPDYRVIKLDNSGNTEWTKSMGGSAWDDARSIIETNDGGYIMTGQTQSNDYDVTGFNGAIDMWVVKLNFSNSSILGRTFDDSNLNCQSDLQEVGVSQFLIHQTSPIDNYIATDFMGNFKIPTFDTVNYVFEPIIPEYLKVFVKDSCFSNHSVPISNLTTDTSGFDFGYELEQCPLLVVEVSSNRRRPCFSSTTSVSYRNDGLVAENNVEVIVELPDSVYPTSVSHTYTINSLGQLVFNLGTLNAQEFGIISIIDSMACELALTNTQACTKAWISPPNICYNNLISPSKWDSSNLVVLGARELGNPNDTCYRFVIKNIGISMEDSLSYGVYSNEGLIQNDSFLLGTNDSIVILVCGVGYAQVLVDQHAKNPLSNFAFFSPPTSDSTIVYVYEYYNIDFNLESTIECLTVTNAYDPNDKNATPSGWGDENYVHPNTLLDYKIRFQNTGNDTAYNIEIIDTIDVTIFDKSSLILGGSSFPYTFEISGDSGEVVFHFLFNNINLLDSFTNEPLSHGFVNFKIRAYDTIPEGTVANNFADIYFDFNPAIRTNTSMVTLQDTIPVDLSNSVSIQTLPNCPTNFTSINLEACDSIFVNAQWYYSSQLIRDTLQDVNSCDSVIEINLNILESSFVEFSESSQAPYTSPSGNYSWTSSGTYYDTLSTSAGCDSIFTINLTILEDTTGISNIKSNFKIYPNPTSNELNIVVDKDNSENYTLRTQDIQGKVIMEKIDFQNQLTISLEQFNAGLYIISINDDNGNQGFYKILKE